MFVLEYDMLRRAYERSIDVDERARYLFDIQAIIRYSRSRRTFRAWITLGFRRTSASIRRVWHSATSSRHY